MASVALYSRQRPPRDRWLIPGALGFLVLAVLFAVGMLLVPGFARSGGTVTQPAAAGTPVGSEPPPTVAPSPSPTPSPTASPTPSPSPPPKVVDGVLLRSVASGLCLDVATGGDPQGAGAQQDTCAGGPAQHWRLSPAGGAATLVNVASGKCLDVGNGSTDDGARVQQWDCNGGANQQWRMQPVDGGPAGTVTVTAGHSGKCLDLPTEQTGPGFRVQQWSCNGQPNQQWTVTAG